MQVFVSERSGDRVSVFSLDGPFLRCFGQQGSGAGKFSSPTGLCISTTPARTELYVADSSNHRVQVIDSATGACTRTWGSRSAGAGQLQSPTTRDVQVSASGEAVYVSDFSNHRVCVFSPEGRPLRVLGKGAGAGEGQLQNPLSIALTRSGTLLVCDYSNHRVQELQCRDGAFVRMWGKQGQGRGEFHSPRGVAVGEDGEVYVCDHGSRVQVFV